jgi:small subunit ribosomal protein S21
VSEIVWRRDFMPVDILLWKSETIDKILRRLKKLEREPILSDAREKHYFEKPCARRRRPKRIALFHNILRRKYENMQFFVFLIGSGIQSAFY